MPVDPFLQPLLATLEPFPDVIDFPTWRVESDLAADAMVAELTEPGPPVASRREVTIEVDGGTIDLVIHTPDLPGPLPVHLYMHGGGWIQGTAKQKFIDIVSQERAVGASCVVVAVDYRKAPEHKFPAGLEDCYSALQWVVEHADELGVRTDVVTVGGGSAGANLAAALTLKARDENGPTIAFQLLEVPALDLAGNPPSREVNGVGYGLETADMAKIFALYLPSLDDARNPYASPLLAKDLSDLPPAHIMSAEFDPLLDDGPMYAERLNAAGVAATFSVGLGHIHVSPSFTKVMPSAAAWRDEAVEVLKKAHEDKVQSAT